MFLNRQAAMAIMYGAAECRCASGRRLRCRVQWYVCVSEVLASMHVFAVHVSIREMQKEGKLKWNRGKRRVPWREEGGDCMSESVRGRNVRGR